MLFPRVVRGRVFWKPDPGQDLIDKYNMPYVKYESWDGVLPLRCKTALNRASAGGSRQRPMPRNAARLLAAEDSRNQDVYWPN